MTEAVTFKGMHEQMEAEKKAHDDAKKEEWKKDFSALDEMRAG